jgi:hypothetical protein
MFVELIDQLRCLHSHADGCLVATTTRTVGRQIIEGTIGCPMCGAEYEIRGGAVWFGGNEIVPTLMHSRFPPDGLVRLAAMIGLDERGGLFVLDAAWSVYARELSEMCPEARFVLISASESEGAGAVLRCTSDAIPLAAGCARGVALDRGTPALVDAAVRALAARGRLVVPADADVPESIALLARDDDWWVGEREPRPTVSAPVTPRRAAPRTGNR